MDPKNNSLALSQPEALDISPYDVSYPVALLSNGISRELLQVQHFVQSIYNAVAREAPVATQVQQALKIGCRYVVDEGEETIKAIERGILKLTQENGRTYAQLRENGRYGKKLAIKKEVFRKGIDPNQMANALQMQALQDQIELVTEQLVLIEGSVRDVLEGQQNDRIALYYSGLSLFLESKSISDATCRQTLQAEALRSLAESAFRLQMTMKSDIRYIEQEEYNNSKKESKQRLIERMNRINQEFAYIHQATMLRAGIYSDLGEMAAMIQVLDEYSGFIETVVKKNAFLLASHDPHDDGTKNGLWARRSQVELDTAELRRALCCPTKTLYLGIAQEGENGEEESLS